MLQLLLSEIVISWDPFDHYHLIFVSNSQSQKKITKQKNSCQLIIRIGTKVHWKPYKIYWEKVVNLLSHSSFSLNVIYLNSKYYGKIPIIHRVNKFVSSPCMLEGYNLYLLKKLSVSNKLFECDLFNIWMIKD